MTKPSQKMLDFLGLEEKDFEKPEVTKAEKTEAQALYTAIMTDTLIEEE